MASGGTTKSLTICTNKESSPVTYQRIRTSCYKHMQTNFYTRSSILPAKPVITQVSSANYESASIALASDPVANLDAPIAYYTITSSKGDVKKVDSWRELTVTVGGLKSSTSYTFTITATSVDGTSPISASSLPVTTQAYVAPVSTSTLAAPVFTLSTIAETKTAGTAITGYTITSSGGTISSYAISPAAPAGLTFSTTTGLLSGTPSSSQSAIPYTITATNASGTATRIFTLTVSAVVYTVGNTGPGGGKVFYVAGTPFACGPARSSTCTYLEAAPALWNGAMGDPSRTWAQSGQSGSPRYDTGTVSNSISPETATASAIGWGYRNTRAIILQGSVNSDYSAAALADAFSVTVNGVVVDDWYLPSKDEITQVSLQVNTIGGMSDFSVYWSSTEFDQNQAWFMAIGMGISFTGKNNTNRIRPIRAF
jgi:hypothetical protein